MLDGGDPREARVTRGPPDRWSIGRRTSAFNRPASGGDPGPGCRWLKWLQALPTRADWP